MNSKPTRAIAANGGDKFDAVVVGTGPGGATVARELTGAGKRVLILEWGGRAPVTGSKIRALLELGLPGRSLLITSKLLAVVRAITTGGSSIYYYGTAFEPPYEMLESHGLDISAEVEEVRAEIPTSPLAGDLIGPRAKRIMTSARDLGYDWQPLPKFFYQDRFEAGRVMGFYEAPGYEAKWNARMFVDEAVEGGSVLITGAKVRRVLVEGGAAVGVEFNSRGETERVLASKVIVSAGGIGSPVILRASGLKGAGHDFFFDPLVCVMGTVGDLESGQEVAMSAGIHMRGEGYMMADMTVPESLYMAMTAQVGRLHKLRSHKRTLQIMIKLKDNLGGRLTDRGGVRKRLAEGDRQRLMNGYERARRILENAGATGIYRSWYMASHPGGTVKVGDLLDTNLKTEYENLYVCDASVIPEAWGLPPTLTLIGLGKRLAKHLIAGSKAGPSTAGIESRAQKPLTSA